MPTQLPSLNKVLTYLFTKILDVLRFISFYFALQIFMKMWKKFTVGGLERVGRVIFILFLFCKFR